MFLPIVAKAEDFAKQVSIAGVGFLYIERTGELTSVHFSVSHRLSRPVTAITFALTFRSPDGTVLKTEQYRHQFQYMHQGKMWGSQLSRDEVYQVKHNIYPNVQGFCPGTCGTIQVRAVSVDTE
ncbi:MAG TPA: hypothetical protein VGQ93_04165 [Lysobacter sp.]|nr:hypothetical protein [Lysobacter sp.]